MWEGLTCFGYLVHPPKDLYDYKVLSPISFTDNEIEEFEFQNKYLGMHDVGIILENYSNEEIFGAMRDLKVYLQINFYIKDKILSSYSIDTYSTDKRKPFLYKKGESGYVLIGYDCPQNLPRKKTLRCELKIIKADDELREKYGPVKFYIKKGSDI